MTERETLDQIASRVSNWGRWGPDDEYGTVNFITEARRLSAVSCVRTGRVVSLSHPLVLGGPRGAPNSAHIVWRSFAPTEAAAEFIGMDFHGASITHLDALNHIQRSGQMYNGFPAAELLPRQGSTHLTVDVMADRLVGRGVLLDLTLSVAGDRLPSGMEITQSDLEEAESRCEVSVGTGDIVFVRTGHRAVFGSDQDGWRESSSLPGLGPECIPWLHERMVAVLGTDVVADRLPQPDGEWAYPIHQLAIVHLGLPILDNCRLEDLSSLCALSQRYSFLTTVAPLRLVGGTGAPLNPLAIL